MESGKKRFFNVEQTDESLFRGKTEKPLDVRPIIDGGEDPFDEIMKNLARLQKNEYLKIINYFEPVPLYARLKQMGYAYRTKKHGMLYHINIIQKNELPTDENSSRDKADALSDFDTDGFLKIDESRFKTLVEKLQKESPEKIAYLDVSDLPAPEPFLKILETINKDPAPVFLVVRHRKKPLHLPGFLKEKNYIVSAFEKKDRVEFYVFVKNFFKQFEE
jgi:uncharacterized protein (DUF2249 family)